MIITPPAVRILPMSTTEKLFADKSIKQVQRDFFLGLLPSDERHGGYFLRKKSLKAEPGTVVLFQFNNQIIATAVLRVVDRNLQTNSEFDSSLHLEVDSIRVFEPVSVAQIRNTWPKFKNFNQTRYHLDAAQYPHFEQQLTSVEKPSVLSHRAQDIDTPPNRIKSTILRIVRDTKRAIRVKSMHEYRCQICGKTISLSDGSNYAEAHHLQPLGGVHCGPDVEENIICVCPNHHAACDLGAIRLEIEKLTVADGHTVGQRYMDYHNSNIYRGNGPA